MNPIIEVQKLSKNFGTYQAVHNVSFTIGKGEIVGLLGPNGAGKTTTIHMMLGIILPTSGGVKIFGKDIQTHRCDILQEVNFSSTYVKMPWTLTVEEGLRVFSLLYNVPNAHEEITRLLKRFGVWELRNTLGGHLSAGQLTRVHLAKAFLNRPKILFLDEPTSSLDPDIAATVREYLKEVQEKEGTTILLTSHNMAEVEELCNRVIVLQKGKIFAQDTPEGLAKTITKVRVSLLVPKRKDKLQALAASSSWEYTREGNYITMNVEEKDIASFLQTLSTSNIVFQEITIEKATLEDYFLTVARLKKEHV